MTVKKWIWKEAAEVIGVLGIIAGIVFLGFELRQNNELMAAESRATRLSIQAAIWNSLIENPELSSLLLKDRNGEPLSVDEELRLNSFWMRNLLYLEWQFESSPDYDGWLTALRTNFSVYGSLRRTWAGNGVGARSAGSQLFSSGFVEVVNEIAADQ